MSRSSLHRVGQVGDAQIGLPLQRAATRSWPAPRSRARNGARARSRAAPRTPRPSAGSRPRCADRSPGPAARPAARLARNATSSSVPQSSGFTSSAAPWCTEPGSSGAVELARIGDLGRRCRRRRSPRPAGRRRSSSPPAAASRAAGSAARRAPRAARTATRSRRAAARRARSLSITQAGLLVIRAASGRLGGRLPCTAARAGARPWRASGRRGLHAVRENRRLTARRAGLSPPAVGRRAARCGSGL